MLLSRAPDQRPAFFLRFSDSFRHALAHLLAGDNQQVPHLAETGLDQFPRFINLDCPVGPECRNLEPDVRVVQYMLQRLYSQNSVRLSTSFTASWSPLRKPVHCNGNFDLATRLSIFRFQIDLSKRYGVDILINGRLEPSLGPDSPTAHLSRIYQLNFPQDYQKLVREYSDHAAGVPRM